MPSLCVRRRYRKSVNVRSHSENRLRGHSLHFGLSAPPTASQAFVPGVATETQDML